MIERLFRITKEGRRVCSSPSPNGRNKILDYLNSIGKGAATDEQLVAVTGISKYSLLNELRKLAGLGLVTEVGQGEV